MDGLLEWVVHWWNNHNPSVACTISLSICLWRLHFYALRTFSLSGTLGCWLRQRTEPLRQLVSAFIACAWCQSYWRLHCTFRVYYWGLLHPRYTACWWWGGEWRSFWPWWSSVQLSCPWLYKYFLLSQLIIIGQQYQRTHNMKPGSKNVQCKAFLLLTSIWSIYWYFFLKPTSKFWISVHATAVLITSCFVIFICLYILIYFISNYLRLLIILINYTSRPLLR